MIQEINTIGWVGTFFSIIDLLPQVVEAFIVGNVDGVSTITIFAFFFGNFFWITYGVGIDSAQVLVSSVIQLAAACILLWFKYGEHIKKLFKRKEQPLIIEGV